MCNRRLHTKFTKYRLITIQVGPIKDEIMKKYLSKRQTISRSLIIYLIMQTLEIPFHRLAISNLSLMKYCARKYLKNI